MNIIDYIWLLDLLIFRGVQKKHLLLGAPNGEDQINEWWSFNSKKKEYMTDYLLNEKLVFERKNDLNSVILNITKAGGLSWEKIRKPDWDLFYSTRFTERNDSEHMVVTSFSFHFNYLYYLDCISKIGKMESFEIKQNTYNNWNVTHWLKINKTVFELCITLKNELDISTKYFDLNSIKNKQFWNKVQMLVG